jgi:hypothetical protein
MKKPTFIDSLFSKECSGDRREENHADMSLAVSNDEMHGISTWRKRHALFIKTVCLAVSLIFLHEQIGWSQEGKAVWAQTRFPGVTYAENLRLNGIKIPYDLGRTGEVEANGGQETIIHIQDAHASLSAQESIAGLLDSLVTDYDLRVIALEGGSGFVDTSLLKTFPDKVIRDGTA